MENHLFIVARAKYLRNDVQRMVVVLGGLGKLRSDIEFLILIESQACCVLGLQFLREQILHHIHIDGFYTHDAARALPLHLQLTRTTLPFFCDRNEVSNLKVWRRQSYLVVLRIAYLRSRVAAASTSCGDTS
jgi:hypothetical protein